MYIYKITNNLTGEFYVGQTINTPEYRFRKHIELSVRGGGYYIHNAMRRYGVNSFSLETLCECETREELDDREIEAIKDMKPHYNICEGGSIKLSPESIKKMANSLTGKKQSQDTIDKRFATLREKEKDPDFLKKRAHNISEAKKKQYAINGRVLTGIQEVADFYGIKSTTAQWRLSHSYKWRLM